MQEELLGIHAAGIAAETPVATDDAVAGHYQGEGVGGACAANGSHGFGVSGSRGDCRVGDGCAICDVGKVFEHSTAKPVSELQIEGEVEALAVASEVCFYLADSWVEPGGGEENAGTDPLGELGKHVVVALDRKGDTY